MTIVNIQRDKKPASLPVWSDKVAASQWFEGKIGSFEGLFLKAYDVVIFMKNPVKTWSSNVQIEDYAPISTLEINY